MNRNIFLFNFYYIFLISTFFVNLSALGMNRALNFDENLISCLQDQEIFSISLETAFKYALQELEKEIDIRNFNALFCPSKIAIENYKTYLERYRIKKIRNLCPNGVRCKKIKNCPFEHYICAAFHGTPSAIAIVKIWQEGFKVSSPSCSMGSGIYFTTPEDGEGWFPKCTKFGPYLVVGIVISHDGFKEIGKPSENLRTWRKNAQDWKIGGADCKFVKAGKKTDLVSGMKIDSPLDPEFGAENVVRDAEKFIPIGVVWRKGYDLPSSKL